ncbi:AMP-binding protein [Thermomonospora amylolytica]|uniref:AMP-binding protein n=1 Tax=Thermomonospora amylolytica TaxID=1411117 RepID=UPI000E6D46A8|nr:AMP-binding protein [Thermomonospora amylolytica]
MGAYAAVYQHSISDPTRFWGLAARDVRWLAPPDRVLDDGAPPFYRWFTGGELNTCDNALDRHVEEGRGDLPALVVAGTAEDARTYTYAELTALTARFAGVLAGLGVARGDRVLVHLPPGAHAVVAMLACARLGAVHVVPAGAGPAPEELAAMIDATGPKAVVAAADGTGAGKPAVAAALRLAAHRVAHCVLWRRPGGGAGPTPPRDVDWDEAMASARPAGCTPVAATDPLHIVFAPGGTGPLKGVVRDNGGFSVALRWSLENLYGIGPGEAIGATTAVPPAAALSCAVYAPLLTGCTIVLCPAGAAPWRAIARHRVKGMLITRAELAALRAAGPDGAPPAGCDLSPLEALFLPGGAPGGEIARWAARVLGRPVAGAWAEPEYGRPLACVPYGLEPPPVPAGSAGLPAPGFDLRVLDSAGEPVPPGEPGALAVRLPLPPGALSTLWREDGRFVETYLSRYPGHCLTGATGRIDERGRVWVTGRSGG